jgi:hypothetical protein
VNEATVFPAAQQTPETAARALHAETVRWGDIIRANRIEATQFPAGEAILILTPP